MVRDGPFHLRDWKGRQVADALLSSSADVVLVALPRLARGGHEEQSTAATGAPHRALEIMIVYASSSSGLALGVEDLLHLIEEVLVDERFVAAGVLDAVVGDV